MKVAIFGMTCVAVFVLSLFIPGTEKLFWYVKFPLAIIGYCVCMVSVVCIPQPPARTKKIKEITPQEIEPKWFLPQMNKNEHLIACSVEEAIEVAEEASAISRNLAKLGAKALRFGLEDKWPDEEAQNNRDKLVDEINDLIGVIEMMSECGIIPKEWLDPNKVKAKKERVEKYMRRAKRNDALQDLQNEIRED